MSRALVLAGFFLGWVADGAEPDVQRRFLLGRSALELSVSPVQVQLRRDTEQVGAGFGIAWHPNDLFAVHVSGLYNYQSGASAFFRELNQKYRLDRGSYGTLVVWGALAGLEVAPLSGETNAGRVSIVLSLALGVAGSRHELMSASGAGTASPSPATFGDTGVRLLSKLGGGFRLELTKHLGFRLEIHDQLYPAQIQTVNGCSRVDLGAMDNQLRNGKPATNAVVGSGCRVGQFSQYEVPIGSNLVKPPGSNEWLHNFTVQLGASVQF